MSMTTAISWPWRSDDLRAIRVGCADEFPEALLGVLSVLAVPAVLDHQAGSGVPAQDLQDRFQIRRELVQNHAPAAVITALAGGQEDKGPQARNIAVLHAREVDVAPSSNRT